VSSDLVPVVGQVVPAVQPGSVREVDAGFWHDPGARDAAVWFWVQSFQSTHTRDAYRRDVGGWFAYCDARGVPVDDARRNDVDGWRDELAAAGLAAATIHRRLAAVSSFYAYWVDEDVVERNPAANVRRPPHSREPASITLTARQARQLLGYVDDLADTRPSVIVRLLAETGMRVGELLGARAEDLAMDDGHYILRITRKGGRKQALPVAPTTRHRIALHLTGRTEGYIVQARRPRRESASGGKLDRWYVWDLLRRVAREAGLPDEVVGSLHPHVFRASCATIAAAAGEPLVEIQRLLGHADPRTTDGYIGRTRGLAASPAYRVAALIAPGQADAPSTEEK
jgi:integrase/recombinase XerD